MRNVIVMMLVASSMFACGGDKQQQEPATPTTVRGGAMQPAASAEEIRMVLIERQPTARDAINALTIQTDADGIVVLRGSVPSEAMKNDLVSRVRSMPNVREVRDELRVQQGMQPGGMQQGGMQQGGMQQGGMQQGGMQQGGMQPGGMQQGGSGMGGSQMGTGDMGGQMGAGSTQRTDAARKSMMSARPQDAAVINALILTDEGGVLIIRGIVPDEPTRKAIVDSAKKTPGVTSVRDETQVSKKK